ncbi:hypothetical protein SAICODRAFT_29985 [Saitoella complicata NRRL Y-17804]|uniref:Uncharacterized protein n=1 Tax=Saitoella complicata (strain BCRC 22490 / CBS 7301 / JCM 7358 / NBRC 10748 / NRRL Y-17804) TaxID=698492 RepID=A0A0E9NH99_SAICN|nr:uncharacterized protein SAICODRAFT_29985 [Saitoella complicata NRRL Y-17804]ODQ53605.1 hypothetical protein SAICODRAFT_29985 [Saitoella complicata NRRL Y-17804]GAO48785.1 hypothetical protein G7K_2954-t1 [Saitoella complicata NRRL Y-17804]
MLLFFPGFRTIVKLAFYTITALVLLAAWFFARTDVGQALSGEAWSALGPFSSGSQAQAPEDGWRSEDVAAQVLDYIAQQNLKADARASTGKNQRSSRPKKETGDAYDTLGSTARDKAVRKALEYSGIVAPESGWKKMLFDKALDATLGTINGEKSAKPKSKKNPYEPVKRYDV